MNQMLKCSNHNNINRGREILNVTKQNSTNPSISVDDLLCFEYIPN